MSHPCSKYGKLVEARAVKRIVALLRARVNRTVEIYADDALNHAADAIERGEWKDVKLPKKGKKR